MTQPILWLHKNALSINHPAFDDLPDYTRIVHIWDDTLYVQNGYSLKRLVFIYETLCELPVEIIYGDTLSIFKSLKPSQIIVPFTVNQEIKLLCAKLSKEFLVTTVAEPPFVQLPDNPEFVRFFKYWKQAQKTAFYQDGVPPISKESP